ncbi:MAG: EVE domain-containing protein [Candidatus Eisenbacteria bacterium]
MAHWLLKTEPSEYSHSDLVKDGKTVWSGIANATALIHLRKMSKGDEIVIYHTGRERRCVGLARAASGPYPDPALGDPKRVVIDIAAGKALPKPVTLEQFKSDPLLEKTDLVKIGRLSVVPLSDAAWARVRELAGG